MACQANAELPVQVCDVAPSQDVDLYHRILTKDDSYCLQQYGTVQMYRAFLCYGQKDKTFVRNLEQMLVAQTNCKYFIKDRDLLPGVIEATALLEIMDKRCRHMIVILSPDFDEPLTNYLAHFGRAVLAESREMRRVIPVIYKACVVPEVINRLKPVEIGDDLSPSEERDLLLKAMYDDEMRNPGKIPREDVDSGISIPSMADLDFP